MPRRTRQALLTLALVIALVVGLRLILGEWNWWLTGLGVVALVSSSLWDARSGRGQDPEA